MTSAPFLKLFPGDYHAKTQHLTTLEHGAYLLLLMAAWGRKDCGLPDDDQFLARTVGLSTQKWSVVKSHVMGFWELEDGYFFNQRLLNDRRKVKKTSLKNSESGAKGAAVTNAKALKLKDRAAKTAGFSKRRKAGMLQLELYSKEYTLKRGSQFKEFWDGFAYKNGRAPALKAWMKIEGYDDALFAQILAGARREAAARPGLIARDLTPKMAQGWITDRRWEDEAPKSAAANRSEWSAAEWLNTYPPDKPFAADYVRRNFCAGDIPEEIRKKYGF